MRSNFVIIFFSALVLVACSGPPDTGAELLAGPTGRISSVSPASGAIDVAVDTDVRVTFNGEVRTDSPEDMLVLKGPDGTPVPGRVSLSEDGRTAILVPEQFLTYNTEYTATVDASETSRGRGRPPQDFSYSWSFTTQPDPVVTLEVVSHQDGQQVFGPRTITLSGTISSGAPVTEVVVRHNGGAILDVLWDQDGFAAAIELDDNDANLIEVLARNEAGKEGSATLSVSYPYFRIETGQAAEIYMGRYNDSQNRYLQGFGGDQFRAPLLGSPSTYGEMLYLPDRGNSRVLVFDHIPTTDGESASFVLGRQADFSTFPSRGNEADQLNGPGTVAIADGLLAVADRGNNRVLIWNQVPLESQPADIVVGQADFGMSGAACASDRLSLPSSVKIVDGKLIVVDSGNHRVLVWNDVPTGHGAPADLVIGQDGFDTCSANRSGSIGQDTLSGPSDAWSNGSKLIVADSGNNRVLVWNEFPATSSELADVVVGQDSFGTGYAGGGESGLYYPTYIESNGNQLFVADTENNRVLVWDVIPTVNGAGAHFALGQGDLFCTVANSTSVTRTYCDNKSTDDDIEKWMLNEPAGLHLFGGRLLVADGFNARYLLFEALPQPQ
jgi:hypothetical protein